MRHLRKRHRMQGYKALVRKEYAGSVCMWRGASGGYYAIMHVGVEIDTGHTKNEAWARAAGAWPVQRGTTISPPKRYSRT